MRKTILFVAFIAIGCGKSGDQKQAPSPEQATSAAAPSAAVSVTPSASAEPSAAPSKTVELEVSAQAAAMTFEPTALTVPAGSTVHLVLQNQKPGALPHNWALVAAGTEAKVAAEGLKKGEEGNYIAEGPDVLAHTKLVPAGSKGEVTFQAPAPGKYPYICTYPGHYVMMKGVLTVTP